MDLGLKDANVVLIGASRGIGRGTGRKFAAEGAKVALFARNWNGLEKTAAQCREAGSPEFFIMPRTWRTVCRLRPRSRALEKNGARSTC